MHIILIFLYLFSSLNGAVYYTYLWQMKEYRWDRMMDGMRTRSGLHRVFPNFQIIKMLFLAIGTVHYIFVKDVNVFFFYAFSAFCVELLEFIARIFARQIMRPRRTAKALLIVIITFALMIVLGALGRVGLILLALSVLVGDINSLVVFAFNPITTRVKRGIILGAKRKLSAGKIKVIGITGSYGKSSTKEFLYQILDLHYQGKVFKTPGNVNVDIGVAQEILKGLTAQHEFAIIEMGAYKKGEIKAICDLVHPTIGVVTAVSDQHLALFGSTSNIQEAKYELIESLPADGIGFFNNDSDGARILRERAKNEKREEITYSCEGRAKIMALHTQVHERDIDFDIHGIKFNAKVFGKQNLPNLLAAIAVAKECGMTFQEIARAVRKIKMPEKIMNLKESATRGKDFLIIDDSYNANPEGVRSALEFLKNFKGYKKVFVFPGMLELGPKTDMEHMAVGEKIREICDFTVFTSSDFLKPLLIGLGKDYDKEKYFVSDSAEQTNRVLNEQLKGEKAVILFESRGSESVIREFLNTHGA